jgi:hypothetical protein
LAKKKETTKQEPGIAIDGSGFTVVNGTRFFPLGIYSGTGPKGGGWASTDENLARISNAGFNTILDYNYGEHSFVAVDSYMARANAHNLKVIYNLKDMYGGSKIKTAAKRSVDDMVTDYVEHLKNSPNLLAWYINDELGLNKLPAISNMYQNIRRNDPGHIIFQVSNRPELLTTFSKVTDVMGTDPYVIDEGTKSFKK